MNASAFAAARFLCQVFVAGAWLLQVTTSAPTLDFSKRGRISLPLMTAELVGDNWEALPSTEAGTYYRVEPQIVVAVPNLGIRQTREMAQRSLEQLDRIAEQAGFKQSVIVLVNRVASQDAEARRVWSTPRSGETRCCQALVCSSMLARAIGSFFLGLNQGAVPTRMFAELEDALSWARTMAREHDGRL